jgi:hypothetical protein
MTTLLAHVVADVVDVDVIVANAHEYADANVVCSNVDTMHDDVAKITTPCVGADVANGDAKMLNGD